jgi:hypothetical protein
MSSRALPNGIVSVREGQSEIADEETRSSSRPPLRRHNANDQPSSILSGRF